MAKLQVGVNDLETWGRINNRPDILECWDYEKNYPLTPHGVCANSNKKAWWKCKKGHSFSCSINIKSGCPYCLNQKLLAGFNDFKTICGQLHYENLLDEWDLAKNSMSPTDVLSKGGSHKFWWKCEKGHNSYKATISSRINAKSGCPICGREKSSKAYSLTLSKNGNSLLDKYPEVAQEWDYERNLSLTPDKIASKSPKMVWWKCSYCGTSWSAKVSNRTRNNYSVGCHSCSLLKRGEKRSYGASLNGNSLGEMYPGLLSEWDYQRNASSPYDISFGSRKEVWWVCDKGHSYQMIVNRRTLSGNGCPYCSGHRLLSGFNDFETVSPEYLCDWDFEKNSVKPSEISSGNSSIKVWWKCNNGHSYHQTVWNKRNSVGCPICLREQRTSFPEQCILFYIKQVFPDVINNDREILSGKELDIYIPSKKVAIEYDGYAWHKDQERDLKKSQLCQEQGIYLFRIREEGCEILDCTDNSCNYTCKSGDWNQLSNIINNLIGKLTDGQSPIDVDIEKDKMIIYSRYISEHNENSFERLYPNVASIWDYEKNAPIKPSMIMPFSNKKFWFTCKKGHGYCTSPGAIVRSIQESTDSICCPVCSNQKVLPGDNDLASLFPAIAREWNYEKNDRLPSEYVGGSNKKIWWKCKEGHEWKASISARTSMKTGCPFCAGNRLLSGKNDLETWCKENNHPDILESWDYKKNVVSPDKISKRNGKKVWWICSLNHSYEMTVANRTSGNGCPYCSNPPKKILVGFNDLATTCPHLLSLWDYDRNSISPNEITRGSGKKVWWKCDNGHSYQQCVGEKALRNLGCPVCNSKKRSDSCKRKIINLDTNQIYDSVSQAQKDLGVTNISRCLCGKSLVAGGYHWAYLEEK